MTDTTRTAAPDPAPIVDIATGFMAAKQLFAASELGLFPALAGTELTSNELAERTGTAPRSCHILAETMVSVGLLEREGERYRNTPAASAYLAGKDGSLDLRPHLAFWNAISYPHWESFASSARDGTPAPLELDGERETTFFTGVQTYNSAHAAMLAEHYDFRGHRKVLDLAGLSGAFLTEALDRDATLRGTFFAEQQMVEFARSGIDDEHRKRIDLVAGDPFTDSLPSGHDVVLLEHVVHRFDAERNRALLARARDAVRPGDRLLVLDFFLDSEPRRALDALLAGEYLVIDGTVVYPESEVCGWVEEAGWRWLETRPLPGSPRVLIAEAVEGSQ